MGFKREITKDYMNDIWNMIIVRTQDYIPTSEESWDSLVELGMSIPKKYAMIVDPFEVDFIKAVIQAYFELLQKRLKFRKEQK